MTKQINIYPSWLDIALQALLITKDTFESAETIQRNLNKNISLTDLEKALNHLCFCLYCEPSMTKIADNKYGEPKLYKITFQGLLFFEEGGFIRRIKDSKVKYLATIAKTILIALNAIAIVIITGFGVYVDYRSNQKDEKLKKLRHQVDSLKKATRTIDTAHTKK